VIALAAAGPSPFWYLTRATGTVSLILLTLSVALGVANVQRLHGPQIPRFVVDNVHRNASLLAVVFLVIHIATSLLDGYAPISVVDAIIPFRSAYRPVARIRGDRVRSAVGSDDHQSGSPPARLRRVARDALGGLRVLAAGARPWAGHRQ